MPNWLGDIVMALPFLQALGERYRGAELHILIPEKFSAVARGYGVVHPFRTPVQSHWVALGLRFSSRFALGFSLPSSYTSNLNLLLAGVRERVGFSREGNFLLKKRIPLPPRGREHLSRTYLRLLGEEGIEAPPYPQLRGEEKPPPPPLPLTEWEKVWVVVPFTTYGSAKELPLERYLSLCALLMEKGYTPLLAGTGEEGKRLPPSLPYPRAFGKYTLAQWLSILPRVAGVIGNDSGFVHLSAACGVKTLVFFLSTSPQWTAPRGRKVEILYDPVPCSPCFAPRCPLGHEACKALWNEGRVLEAVEALLKSPPA